MTLITPLILLCCVGCGEDEPPRGAAAVKDACEGILDEATVKEAAKNDKFHRTYNATGSGESHAAAAKTIVDEDHSAYVCRLAVADAAKTGDDALWVKFTPNLGHLFPEEETRSHGYFKAYKLGPGLQAAIKSTGTDVYFPCNQANRSVPISVTGTLYSDMDLSIESRFRVIFRSATKMVHLLKCTNDIGFPSPDTMKPLPDAN